MRTLIERLYFALCLGVGRALRSARYAHTLIVSDGAIAEVRKRRSCHAPFIVWIGGPLLRAMNTGVRVLARREWQERERRIYQSLYETSPRIEPDGTLVLPCFRGETLATLLERRDVDESVRERAIELAVGALADLHRRGLTHGDAMAENVIVDLEAGNAHWFDFETVHESTRTPTWCRADDVRALLASCLIRSAPEAASRNIALVLHAYADESVTPLVAIQFTSVWRRPLAFHLGQAALSFPRFAQIGRQLNALHGTHGPAKPTSWQTELKIVERV